MQLDCKHTRYGRPFEAYLNKSFECRDGALQDRMEDEIRFHHAHGLQGALDIGDCGAVLREHCEQAHCP